MCCSWQSAHGSLDTQTVSHLHTQGINYLLHPLHNTGDPIKVVWFIFTSQEQVTHSSMHNQRWHSERRKVLLMCNEVLLMLCFSLPRNYKCTSAIQNTRNTFNRTASISSEHGLYKVHARDAGPWWLQCFPQLCQVAWTSFGWWTILDTHGRLLSVRNPAVLQFLTQTSVPGTYYHKPFKDTHLLSCLFTL
jgi:hypothetical protein